MSSECYLLTEYSTECVEGTIKIKWNQTVEVNANIHSGRNGVETIFTNHFKELASKI